MSTTSARTAARSSPSSRHRSGGGTVHSMAQRSVPTPSHAAGTLARAQRLAVAAGAAQDAVRQQAVVTGGARLVDQLLAQGCKAVGMRPFAQPNPLLRDGVPGAPSGLLCRR